MDNWDSMNEEERKAHILARMAELDAERSAELTNSPEGQRAVVELLDAIGKFLTNTLWSGELAGPMLELYGQGRVAPRLTFDDATGTILVGLVDMKSGEFLPTQIVESPGKGRLSQAA